MNWRGRLLVVSLAAFLGLVTWYALLDDRTLVQGGIHGESAPTAVELPDPQILVEERSRMPAVTARNSLFYAAINVQYAHVDWISTLGGDQAHLQVILQRLASHDTLRLPAREGRWSGDVPLGEYAIKAVEASDRVFEFTASNSLSAATPEVDVVLFPRDEFVVEVLDATHGNHLSQVTVVSSPSSSGTEAHRVLRSQVPTADASVVVDRAVSPIELPALEASCVYWVTAEGYDWKQFIRSKKQYRIRLALNRSGALRVDVINRGVEPFVPRQDFYDQAGLAELTVEPLLESQSLEQQSWSVSGGEQISIDPITSGPYRISVRLRSPSGAGALVWQEDVEVLPVLDPTIVEALLLPPRAHGGLQVTLFTPPDADMRQWSLQFWHRQIMEARWRSLAADSTRSWSVVDTPGVYRESYSQLQPGEYLLQLSPVGLCERIVVTGNEVLEISLDAMSVGRVNVHVSGPAALTDGVYLTLNYVDGSCSQVPQQPVPAGFPGSTILYCLPEPVSIRAQTRGLASQEELVIPEPNSEVDIVLQLVQGGTALLRAALWEDGGHAYVPEDFWTLLEVEPVGHAGELRLVHFGIHGTSAPVAGGLLLPDWSQCVMEFSGPGSYILRHPHLGDPLLVNVPLGLTDLLVFKE